MSDEIKLEIANQCEEYPINDKCVEEQCVLFRIEQIIEESEAKNERLDR